MIGDQKFGITWNESELPEPLHKLTEEEFLTELIYNAFPPMNVEVMHVDKATCMIYFFETKVLMTEMFSTVNKRDLPKDCRVLKTPYRSIGVRYYRIGCRHENSIELGTYMTCPDCGYTNNI